MLQSFLSVSYSNKAHTIGWHKDRVLSEVLESIRKFLLEEHRLTPGKMGIGVGRIHINAI